jgi:sulfur-oxidizing protein SoxY
VQAWETAMRSVTGDAKIVDGRINMDLPEIAENGNVVPMNITVTSAMTDTEFVRTLRLFSTGNPQALIATFRFSPLSGKAAVSGRIRLAKTQDVVALAELSDGTFLRGRKNVKVTIGGCGG